MSTATTATHAATRPAAPWWRPALEAVAIVALVFALFSVLDAVNWARLTELRAGAGPKFPDDYVGGLSEYGEVWAAKSTVTALAALAVWASWRLRTVRADGPAGLLSLATLAMPGSRREWGDAMVAELAGVESGPARWRFALSCLRPALFAPRAPAATGGRRPGRAAALVVGLVSVLLGAAAVAYAQVRYPAQGWDRYALAVTAVGLLVAGWFVVAAPGRTAHDRFAVRAGMVLGLAVATVVLAVGILGLFFAVVAGFWVVLTVAAVRQSFRTGLRTALWGAAFAALGMVPAFVVSALVSFARTGEIWYGDGVQRNEVLGEAIHWVVPSVANGLLPLTVLGAALGALVGTGGWAGIRARLVR